MKRYSAAIGLFLAILTTSTPALAQLWQEGIINGAQLIWSGTLLAPNDLDLQPGEIEINANVYQIPSTAFVTSPRSANIFYENGMGGAQASNTPYYVYAAVNPVSGLLQYVIALVQPNPGGEPSQSLTWPGGAGGGNVSSQYALFLGSYVTDGTTSADIVPFLKEGDDVILTPFQGTFSFGGAYATNAVTFSPAPPAYPQVGTATFPAATTPIPLSASGLIVDFDISNTDNAIHDARILNPTLNGDVGAGVCTANSQYYLAVSPVVGGIAIPAWPYGHARIKTAINTSIPAGAVGQAGLPANALNTLKIGACTAPGAGAYYSVTAVMAGYTEVTHHISF